MSDTDTPMTRERAERIVHELLLNVQKARSDIAEFWDWFETGGWDHATIERAQADLHRWLFGEQGERFVMLLADLDAGVKPLDGLTLMNLMTIAHRLEPAIGMVAMLRGWDLPEPRVRWVAELQTS